MERTIQVLSGMGGFKATLCGAMRHHSEGWSAGDLSGGASLLFRLAIRSGYNRMFPASGCKEACPGFGGPWRGTQIRERGEVCSVIQTWRQ
jgi:hypothetical protein